MSTHGLKGIETENEARRKRAFAWTESHYGGNSDAMIVITRADVIHPNVAMRLPKVNLIDPVVWKHHHLQSRMDSLLPPDPQV